MPVDLVGGAAFPPIGQLSYLLTLAPYGFMWFILATEAALPPWHVRPSEPLPELTTLVARNGLSDVLTTPAKKLIEAEALPAYLMRRRWFAAKDKGVKAARLRQADKIPGRTLDILLAEVEVHAGEDTLRYNLPLGISWDGETNSALPQQLALARVRQGRRMGFLTDAFAIDAFPLGLIRALRTSLVVPVHGGEIRCLPTRQLEAVELPETPEILRLSAEQSNSSLIVGNKIIMKIIRRVMAGVNPEVEMVRYLTEKGFRNTPPLLGEVVRHDADGTFYGMIVAQAFMHNQGDAWQYTLNFLSRFLQDLAGPEDAQGEASHMAPYAVFSRAMGTRLGELHALLAQPSTDEAFDPLTAGEAEVAEWARGAAAQLEKAFDTLRTMSGLRDGAADFVLGARDRILLSLQDLAEAGIGSLRTRVHGDFHLGQVLVSREDAYLIDFEGEPAKPLEVRRGKSSPMRDVAGLLRSFHYAAAAAKLAYESAPGMAGTDVAAPLARFVEEMSAQFLNAYRAVELKAAPRWVPDERAEQGLLDLFLLEKSAYEICYEAANRPHWIDIPLGGFTEIAKRVLHVEVEQADG